MTLPTAEESLRQALQLLAGSPTSSTTRRARKILDDAHEALVRGMVRDAGATACVSGARRRLKDGDVKGSLRRIRMAIRELGLPPDAGDPAR
jgi:hypothetical protein